MATAKRLQLPPPEEVEEFELRLTGREAACLRGLLGCLVTGPYADPERNPRFHLDRICGALGEAIGGEARIVGSPVWIQEQEVPRVR